MCNHQIDKRGFSTRAVRSGEEIKFNNGYGDVVVPIHLTTTYARQSLEEIRGGYDYIRSGNPTRQALEEKLASLEGSSYAYAFSSGLAAESSLLLSLLHQGDHIIAFYDIYGGTQRLFNDILTQYGFEITYVDATEPENVERAIRENTRLVWIESPSNPFLRLCDIQAIADIAHKKDVLLVVDNTFLSPYFQRPLELGADVVSYSATKYLGGHSDVLAGALTTNNKQIADRIYLQQNATGTVLSPFDSYLVLRGVKTLELRMERHQYNATKIAQFLKSEEKIEEVYYPGLEDSPQHELALKQQTGFGGVVSFRLKGDKHTVETFISHLEIIPLAVSLGSVESLLEVPSYFSHAELDEETKNRLGITDTLIRLSVGIENVEDLIGDLKTALSHI
ncbi:MAG: PLP-dependent transferase [Bacteroidaceae bacterium]|nr:PLP-dependent transferase [Bacteroidaceae bacterium]